MASFLGNGPSGSLSSLAFGINLLCRFTPFPGSYKGNSIIVERSGWGPTQLAAAILWNSGVLPLTGIRGSARANVLFLPNQVLEGSLRGTFLKVPLEQKNKPHR